MNTELEAMVGYLAGRGGTDAARIRAAVDDPTSQASRFLESTRKRTRALLDDGPAGPVIAPAPRRPRSRQVAGRAAVAALIVAAVALPLGFGEARARRLEVALAEGEARSRSQARRLEEALARAAAARPVVPARPSAPAPAEAGDGPTRLALGRVEEGLGKLERRLDGLARAETGPAPAPGNPPLDPAVAEIRAEVESIRRDVASAEQATGRQLQEMRTVLQELNQVLRRALSRQPGQPGPMGGPNAGFNDAQPGVDVGAQIQAVVNNLSSHQAHVRLEAVEQLVRFGPPARVALPSLRQLAHRETDARVRAAAQAAITLLQSE